ncbi:hypothetical protein [Alteromonas sp. a30]|uniref:hypothetical protein n=1 Tax=Alteromonas sp. a30 TaxID=2730917 RepID=UPI00227E2012|nr:hypothetical protein [Alteromonas sp. a30]MCY7293804.1 hypothetical protein [Alteromonas sp. a30]
MKKIIFTALLTFLFCSPILAQNTESYLRKLENDASSVRLHPHQFIYATQTLAQGHYSKVEVQQPIPPKTFEFFQADGKVWQNQASKPVSDEFRFKNLPYLVNDFNEFLAKHASTLRLSVLDLNRFYTLRENKDYVALFQTVIAKNNPQHKISALTVEFLCDDIENDCNREFNRVKPEQVAQLWEKAQTNGLLNKQLFVVRYVSSKGEQVGDQELWRFHSGFGPRYFEDM